MVVSDKIYFWKRRNIATDPARHINPFFIVGLLAILLLVAGGGSYYYFFWQPEQERLAKREVEKKAMQSKISAIEKFYRTSLSGGSIASARELLEQIYLTNSKMRFLGFTPKSIKCTEKECALSYTLSSGRIFNMVDVHFFGETYQPSFSKNSVDFTGVKSGLDEHPLAKAWREKTRPMLPNCSDIISFSNTWNSLAGKTPPFEMKNMPASSVINDEAKFSKAVSSFGMLFATWTLSFKENMDMAGVAVALNKQPFAQALIIKSIEFNNHSALVTGGLACTKGH